jgi:flagellar assembly protein FliH
MRFSPTFSHGRLRDEILGDGQEKVSAAIAGGGVMTSLIRRGDLTGEPIRPLAPGRSADELLLDAFAGNAPAPFRDPELLALERKAQDLARQLEETRANLSSQVEAARAEARREAALAHRRDDAKTVEMLEGAVKASLQRLEERLAGIDAFALLMSETALEKVFAGAQDYRDLMSRAIRRQVNQLRSETGLGVMVSQSDFPDETSLHRLSAALGGKNLSVSRDAKLARGECRIDLRLGRIELSLPEHWEKLQAMLRSLPGTERA